MGTAAVAALTSGAVLYRAVRGLWPRRFASIEGGYADGADVAAGWLPEAIVLVAVVLPSAVGVAIAASANDWRWAVTGMATGALVPVVGVLAATLGVADRVDGGMELGQAVVAVLVVAVGLPIALLAWMWSGDAVVFLTGGGICLGLAMVMLLFARGLV